MDTRKAATDVAHPAPGPAAPVGPPGPASPVRGAGERWERPFFWLLYLFLAIVWAITVANPGMRRPAVLVPFTLLLAVHGLAHSQIWRARTRRGAVTYLLLQITLIALLNLLTQAHGMVIALLFPVAGEVFGLFARARHRAVALAAIVVTWATIVLLTGGGQGLWLQVPLFILAVSFVGVYVVLFLRQAEERARAETLLQQLEATHAELRAYAARVEELSIAQERQRMARELHDTLAQGLAGLVMQLEAVDDLLERGEAGRARTVVSRALQRSRDALREAREAIQALRTPLEQGDLVAALQQLLAAVQSDTGLRCTLEVSPADLHVDTAAAEPLYRVAQEGLNNVVRHARGRQATLRLVAGEAGVSLEVVDDGQGFDPQAVAGRSGHFGLVGLQERLRPLGGHLAVESRPGAGTRLKAMLPTGRATAEG